VSMDNSLIISCQSCRFKKKIQLILFDSFYKDLESTAIPLASLLTKMTSITPSLSSDTAPPRPLLPFRPLPTGLSATPGAPDGVSPATSSSGAESTCATLSRGLLT
jgi:hypothetical protein